MSLHKSVAPLSIMKTFHFRCQFFFLNSIKFHLGIIILYELIYFYLKLDLTEKIKFPNFFFIKSMILFRFTKF